MIFLMHEPFFSDFPGFPELAGTLPCCLHTQSIDVDEDSDQNLD